MRLSVFEETTLSGDITEIVEICLLSGFEGLAFLGGCLTGDFIDEVDIREVLLWLDNFDLGGL